MRYIENKEEDSSCETKCNNYVRLDKNKIQLYSIYKRHSSDSTYSNLKLIR